MEENVKESHEKSGVFSAIDVGTTKIVALVGRKNEEGRIEVLGVGEVAATGMAVGTVINASLATKSIIKAVELAREEAGCFPSNVVVGVAGRHVRSMTHSTGLNRADSSQPISKEDLDQLEMGAHNAPISYGERIIDVIPISYLIDNKETISNPEGIGPCHRIDANFNVVYGKIDDLNLLQQCIEGAGLSVGSICLEPIASAKAVLSEEQRKNGVALIDIGGGTSDIAIFKDGKLRSVEIVSIAGNNITSDIAMSCDGMSFEVAESVKIEHGRSVADFAKDNVVLAYKTSSTDETKQLSIKTLAQIIQSRAEDIIDSAQFAIGTSPYGREIPEVVVTGGGANLKDFTVLLKYKIAKKTSVKAPTEVVLYNAETFSDCRYSTAVGLLMRAAEIYEQEHQNQEIVEETSVEESSPVVEELEEVAVEEPKVEKKPKEHKKFGDRLRRGIDLLGKKLVDGLDMNDEN